MTGDEMLLIRHKIGLSKHAMADQLAMHGNDAARRLRSYEDGERPIPQGMARLVRFIELYARENNRLPAWEPETFDVVAPN